MQCFVTLQQRGTCSGVGSEILKLKTVTKVKDDILSGNGRVSERKTLLTATARKAKEI
jgi:hypothetical protein